MKHAIKVNNEIIRPEDLCIGECDHESLIEYWTMHEVEGLCENAEIEKRLTDLLYAFARTPESLSITFDAMLDGERRYITIKKV